MKKFRFKHWLAAAMATILVIMAVQPVYATVPTAASFSVTASTVGATLLQLQGADAENTSLLYAVTGGPSHGTLSGLDTALGYVVYTPTANYTGADSFTYTVTSGGQTSSAGTVSITVTNAKTRIVDTLTDSSGTALSGMVTFILTQKVQSPGGLIPVTATVSATLSAGAFDVSLYPSTALSPQAYYQLWYKATGSLRQELLGVYAIPATSATSIGLAPYRVTDTNLAAQYSFMPAAAINALVTGLGSPVVSFNGRTGAITPATNDYTWAQINKSTSSIADITTRSAADLSSGTLPPARLGSLTDGTMPYKTSSNLADSPLSRISAGGVRIATGNEAVPSTSNYLTATKLLLYPATSGSHLGIGVESGAMWFNSASTNYYKFYWGADAAHRHRIAENEYRIDTDSTTFTFNFHSAGLPASSAFVLNTNADNIRISTNDAAAWDFQSNVTLRPYSDLYTDIGDSTHRVVNIFGQNVKFYGSSSGVTTVSASAAAGSTTLTLPAATDTLVGKATTDTLTNKTLDAEGTGNSVTLPFRVFLAAAGCNNTTAGSFWDLPTSTAASPACVTGTNTQKGVLDFADSGPFVAQNTLILPADFSGAIDARIIWTTSATSGNAKWSLATICTDVAASATDDPSFNTASTVTTAAPGTANRVQTSAITGVTATGCSAGNLLHLKISRDGTDGSDTIGATARLIGVEITHPEGNVVGAKRA